MDENVPTAKRARHIRGCSKCGGAHYGHKDDNCPRILVDRGGAGGEVWILPADFHAGRRWAPRRQLPNNREERNENNDNGGAEADLVNPNNDEDHLDPNLQGDSDGEEENEPPGQEIPHVDRVWEDHNMRNPPRRRNVAEGQPIHLSTLPK